MLPASYTQDAPYDTVRINPNQNILARRFLADVVTNNNRVNDEVLHYITKIFARVSLPPEPAGLISMISLAGSPTK